MDRDEWLGFSLLGFPLLAVGVRLAHDVLVMVRLSDEPTREQRGGRGSPVTARDEERHAMGAHDRRPPLPPDSDPHRELVTPLTASEYERLAEFRHTLRQLERQTETEARNASTTPQQYLLLLAVKGHAGDEAPNLTELAEVLQVVHNSVVQLVNRAEAQGLVTRREDPRRLDRRVVQIHLTPDGERLLARVSGALRTERQRIADLVRWVTQPD